jgi:hypothetical protein
MFDLGFRLGAALFGEQTTPFLSGYALYHVVTQYQSRRYHRTPRYSGK